MASYRQSPKEHIRDVWYLGSGLMVRVQILLYLSIGVILIHEIQFSQL